MIDFDTIKAKATQTMDTAATAAKRLAGTVKTNVNVYAEEERLKGIFQTLGKRLFTARKTGKPMDEEEIASLCAQATQSLRKIEELRAQDNVAAQERAEEPEEVVTDADFVDL